MKAAGTLAVGLALLALPVAAVVALVVAAPDDRPEGPSAYASGDANLTVARRLAGDLGYPVAAVVSDLGLLTGDALVIVPGADEPFAPRQQAALEGHLARGGSVWVAGGVGLAPWLAGLGASIGTQPLLQEGQTGGEVLLAGGLGADRFMRASSLLPGTLLLDEGTAWQVWLEAPASAHIDLDRDGRIGQADPPGPFPVGAALRQSSGGLLIVTADATLLSDAAMARNDRDNVPLWQGVLDSLRPRAGVLFDESQHGWSPAEAVPVSAVSLALGVAALPAWLLAAAGLASVAAAALLVSIGRPLQPYGTHRPSDPTTPSAGLDLDVADIAWDLLAQRTGRPMAELRAAGPEAARGLADDPALRRVLLGQGSAQDRLAILASYTDDLERPA